MAPTPTSQCNKIYELKLNHEANQTQGKSRFACLGDLYIKSQLKICNKNISMKPFKLFFLPSSEYLKWRGHIIEVYMNNKKASRKRKIMPLTKPLI